MRIEITQKLIDRFWRFVYRGLEDECWNWIGSTTGEGYGRFSVGGRNGKKLGAHQVSYMIKHGSIPEGLFVLHKCNNKVCVNPNHLYAGTHEQNMLDLIDSGRSRRDEHLIKVRRVTAEKLIRMDKSNRFISKATGMGRKSIVKLRQSITQ